MITLIHGNFQTANNIGVPNGSITLELNVDAQVIASPFGQVMASIPVTFKFDSTGNLSGTCQIWSNFELNPTGTTYLVNTYDQNGARVSGPIVWKFTQAAGAVVDIGAQPNLNVPTPIVNPSPETLDVNVLITAQSPVTNVLAYGNALTGTGKQAYSGSMTSGNANFSIGVGDDLFTTADVGKTILVSGSTANQDVNDYWGTITSFVSSTQVTVSPVPSTTFVHTNEVYWWDPSQDDTLAIQNAINFGGTVYMPHGVYVLNATDTPLQYSTSLRAIVGDGRRRTVWVPQNASFNSRYVHFLDPNDLLVKDITFRGPGINGIFGGNLSFDLLNQSNIENLRIEGVEMRNTCASSAAIFVNTPILSRFTNVKCVLNVSAGIWLQDAVSCSLEDCYCITNVTYGIWIDTGAGIDIFGCACESNGISYYIQNAENVSIHGCDSEAQVHRCPSAPASFPSVTVAAGGSIPVGTYFLKFTWVRQYNNTAENLESTASPESALVTLTGGNQTINFTLPAHPTDAPNVKFANIYMTPTNGASGAEGFESTITLNSSGTTAVSLSTFSTPLSAPPTVSALGHSIVIDGCSYVSVEDVSSNGLGSTDSRHVWVTNNSNKVSVRNVRCIGTPTPAFNMQIDSGCTNCELDTDLAANTISNSGTNTLIRSGATVTNLTISGTGTAVTQPVNDNSTKLATTAYADRIASGGGLPSLTNDNIWVGNGSNVATAVVMSGDVTMTNAGATTLGKIQGTSITGVTGTGNVVLSTSPTISTSETCPLIIGGTGTTSTLTLRSTSGVGTTGADIIFQTGNNGGTEVMRCEDAGNVGVGTNAPDVNFVIGSSVSAGAMQFAINNTAAGGSEWYLGSTDNGNGSGGGKFLINNSNGTNSPKFCIDSSGNVGINTKAPGVFLEVKSTVTAGAPQMLINNTAAGGNTWYLGVTDNGNAGIAGAFMINTANTPTGSALKIDSTGNFLLNKLVTQYNAISTVSNGIPAEYATVDLTGQGANIGATTLYAVPSSGAGMYRVSIYIIVTQAATTSSTMPSVTITWTDKDNSSSQTLTPTSTNAGNSLTTFAQASTVLMAKASTNIQYSTSGYATSGATSMQYALHLKVEAL